MSAHRYRVVVEGELGPRYASAFDGMTVSARNGTTEITGPIIDSAHLQGLLDRIAGVGLAARQVGFLVRSSTALAYTPIRQNGSTNGR